MPEKIGIDNPAAEETKNSLLSAISYSGDAFDKTCLYNRRFLTRGKAQIK